MEYSLGVANVFPNFENAVIPIEKFTMYSLNAEREFSKATAFEMALGYTIENADKLMENIRHSISDFVAMPKGHNGHGETFECVMCLMGLNRKQANVLTSWIIEDGTDFPRLTNCYITKKKARKPE